MVRRRLREPRRLESRYHRFKSYNLVDFRGGGGQGAGWWWYPANVVLLPPQCIGHAPGWAENKIQYLALDHRRLNYLGLSVQVRGLRKFSWAH